MLNAGDYNCFNISISYLPWNTECCCCRKKKKINKFKMLIQLKCLNFNSNACIFMAVDSTGREKHMSLNKNNILRFWQQQKYIWEHFYATATAQYSPKARPNFLAQARDKQISEISLVARILNLELTGGKLCNEARTPELDASKLLEKQQIRLSNIRISYQFLAVVIFCKVINRVR